MRFSDAMVAAIQAQPSCSCCQVQVVQMSMTHWSAMPSKAIIWTALEQSARAAMGIDPACTVDWSAQCQPNCKSFVAGTGAIDWAALLAFLEKILAVLLPLVP